MSPALPVKVSRVSRQDVAFARPVPAGDLGSSACCFGLHLGTHSLQPVRASSNGSGKLIVGVDQCLSQCWLDVAQNAQNLEQCVLAGRGEVGSIRVARRRSRSPALPRLD